MPAPSVVYRQNCAKFMRAMPAGSEMYCLMTGTRRPTKVLM